jgi:hypothetical protein
MTILARGTFKVIDKRKSITAAVEREVRKRYQLDHRPALTDRPYDTEAGDFIPPQNDPAFIFLIEKPEHDQRTFGRKAGAEKTVTTRGSDVGERARSRNIRDSERLHQARLANKSGDHRRAAELRSSVEKKSRLKPKAKIQSRPFQQGHRPLRSRNNRRRAKQ